MGIRTRCRVYTTVIVVQLYGHDKSRRSLSSSGELNHGPVIATGLIYDRLSRRQHRLSAPEAMGRVMGGGVVPARPIRKRSRSRWVGGDRWWRRYKTKGLWAILPVTFLLGRNGLRFRSFEESVRVDLENSILFHPKSLRPTVSRRVPLKKKILENSAKVSGYKRIQTPPPNNLENFVGFVRITRYFVVSNTSAHKFREQILMKIYESFWKITTYFLLHRKILIDR